MGSGIDPNLFLHAKFTFFVKKSRACFKDHIKSEKIVNYLKQRDKGAEYQSGRLLERYERYVFSFYDMFKWG